MIHLTTIYIFSTTKFRNNFKIRIRIRCYNYIIFCIVNINTKNMYSYPQRII